MKMASTERTAALFAALVLSCCSGNNGTDNNGHEDNNHGHEENNESHGDAGDDHDSDGHGHEDGGHTEEHDLGAPDLNGDAGLTAEAFTYCDCMLINCHDPFHERWGADDVEARNNCAREASAWPVTGSPQTSGDSVECRIAVCEGVADRRNTCPEALGEGNHPCQ